MAHGISPLMMHAVEHQHEVALSEYRDTSRQHLLEPYNRDAACAYIASKAALSVCENRLHFYRMTDRFTTQAPIAPYLAE